MSKGTSQVVSDAMALPPKSKAPLFMPKLIPIL